MNGDKDLPQIDTQDLDSTSEAVPDPWDAQPVRRLVLRGGFWAVLGYGLGQCFRVVSNLVLAHLLAPESFGLMALVTVFLSGLQMFSDIGVGPSIIHSSRGDERRLLNTAFSVQILRGIFLFAVSCLVAYPFSVFYEEPLFLKLIPVAAFSVLVSGLNSTSLWTLTRRIEQGKLTALRLASDLAGVAVSIVWACFSPSVWALVGGVLARTAITAGASHLLLPEKNRLEWDWVDFRELYLYGRLIFLSTATFFLAAHVERLILGKYVSMAQLGVFSIAYLLATFPSMALTEINSRVLFPTVARSWRTDRRRAMRQYTKARALLALLTTAMAVFLILGGKPIVEILLPGKYAEAGWMVQILTLIGIFNVAGSTMVSLLMADARLVYAPVGNLARFAVICTGVWGALHYYDLRTAIWILSLSPLPSYIVYVWGLGRHFREALWMELLFAPVTTLAVAGCFWVVL